MSCTIKYPLTDKDTGTMTDSVFAAACSAAGGTVYNDVNITPGGPKFPRVCAAPGSNLLGDNCPNGQECGLQTVVYDGIKRLEPCCVDKTRIPYVDPTPVDPNPSPVVPSDPGGTITP